MKRPSPALLVATAALVASASGGAYAASGLITGKQIAKNAITGKKIAKNTITGKHIKDGPRAGRASSCTRDRPQPRRA